MTEHTGNVLTGSPELSLQVHSGQFEGKAAMRILVIYRQLHGVSVRGIYVAYLEFR